MGVTSGLFEALQKENPWEKNGNDIWLVSSLCFLRNLDRYKFPQHLELSSRKQILQVIDQQIESCKNIQKPQFFPAEQLTPQEKEYLVEHFVVTMTDIHHARAGQGFILGDQGKLLLSLNIRDHLHLQVLDFTESLETSLNHLIALESELGSHLNYAFSSRFGFHTADLQHCGTGLIVQVFLHLPALIHDEDFDLLLSRCEEEGVEVCGIQGKKERYAGDVVILQNSRTIGLSEEQIISMVRTRATKLLVDEQSKRQQFKKDQRGKIKDAIARAYGLLTNSFRMETLECLDAVSMLKLGASLGWVEGLSSETLNSLFFDYRRGHLSTSLGEVLDPKDLAAKRSSLLKQALTNSKLTFS